MKFSNCPVSINGVIRLASTASIRESLSLAPVPSLGTSSSRGNNPSDKPRGQMSFSYYLVDSDSSTRALAGAVPVSGKIGTYGFQSGFLSSYSISAQPNSLIQANATFDFFQKIESDLTPDVFGFSGELAHASESYPDLPFFNNNLFSFEYGITQSVSPYFYLGQTEICSANLDQGSVTITLEGSGLGGAISYPCAEKESVNFVLADICGNELGTLSEDGLRVESSELNLTSEDGLVGRISLSKSF